MRNLICIGKSMASSAKVMGLIGVEWLTYVKIMKSLKDDNTIGILAASLGIITGITITGVVLSPKAVESILEIE